MKISMEKISHIILSVLIVMAVIKALGVEPMTKFHTSLDEMISIGRWSPVETNDASYEEYACIVPKNRGNELVLAVKGYNDNMKVFVNEKEIYTYKDENYEKGPYWRWVELPKYALGKKLTLQIGSNNKKDTVGLEGNVYFGPKSEVYLTLLKENIYALFWGEIILLVALAICISSVWMSKRVAGSVLKGGLYLGLFTLMVGIWIVTDSYVTQLGTEKMAAMYFISVISLTLIPYFLLKFIRKMMFYETKGITILYHLHLLNAVVNSIFYLFNLFPIHRLFWVTQILILISVVVVLVSATIEIRKYENKEMKKISFGIVILLLAVCCSFGFYFFTSSSYYAIAACVGVSVFIVCLIVAAVDRLHYYLVVSASAEEYQRIAHTDIMTRMGNRLAFTEQQEEYKGKINACVVLDINNLKKANDNYGHEVGDKLIVDAADCIKEAFGKIGNCYRIGGDEFSVILLHVMEADVEAGFERLEKQLALRNKDRDIPIRIAYGYAMKKKESTTFQELFNKADSNMYDKKQEMKAADKLNNK